jgi:hypothetical protein
MSNYRKFEVKSRSVTFSLGSTVRMPVLKLLIRKRVPSFGKRNGVVRLNF